VVARENNDFSGFSFAIILQSIGHRRADVIHAVCEITRLGLKEASELVGRTPVRIMEHMSDSDTRKIEEKLQLLGAEVRVGIMEKIK
jgi:large subunit ribosomal protein L7/L12